MKKNLSIICILFTINVHAQQYELSIVNYNDSAAFCKSVQNFAESLDTSFYEENKIVLYDFKIRTAFLRNDYKKVLRYIDSFILLTGKTDLRVANIFHFRVYAKAKMEGLKNNEQDFTDIFTNLYKTEYQNLDGEIQYRLITNYNYRYNYINYTKDEIDELIIKNAKERMLTGDDALDLVYLYATYQLYGRMWPVLSISPDAIGTK